MSLRQILFTYHFVHVTNIISCINLNFEVKMNKSEFITMLSKKLECSKIYTSKVVEAMARNPLAAKNLKRNMFIQGFFLLLFIGTGYFITYILLRG